MTRELRCPKCDAALNKTPSHRVHLTLYAEDGDVESETLEEGYTCSRCRRGVKVVHTARMEPDEY